MSILHFSIQLFQLRLSPNTSAKGLLGIAKKIINFLAIPSQQAFALVLSTFPLCSGTTLIEIAVYSGSG